MATDLTPGVDSTSSPTRFAELGQKTIAYRSIGSGQTILLCNRFRGILDSWDPAFLDALARNFTVITFDYSGIGRSDGKPPTSVLDMATDALDLADALGLQQFVIGGWSMGGVAAQSFVADYPDRITHGLLIGTNPMGRGSHAPEQLFFDIALKPINDLADEEILFFEPASEASRKAASESHDRIAARTTDRDIPVKPEVFRAIVQVVGADIGTDPQGVREKLMATKIPLLIISGDHDISFPVENWYELSGKLPTAQHIVIPQSGHGPQHQYPDTIARYITTFVTTV